MIKTIEIGKKYKINGKDAFQFFRVGEIVEVLFKDNSLETLEYECKNSDGIEQTVSGYGLDEL